MTGPRILITLDAVGGVWRYAIDLAAGIRAMGGEVVFAGLGPEPSPAQRAESAAIGPLEWGSAPLDWMAGEAAELAPVAPWLDGLTRRYAIDILHLNLPSQAVGLRSGLPVLAVSHSCPTTWRRAMGRNDAGTDNWHARVTAAGLRQADYVVTPTQAHGQAICRCYGALPNLVNVANSSSCHLPQSPRRAEIVAVGRWWDDGKNGRVLDAAAGKCAWPVNMIGPAKGPVGAETRTSRARLTGPLEHSETLARICGAGIFCAPSRYEPFGLAVLEAARAGRPLVLADIPSFRELWHDAAIFFDPDEPQELARLLNHLIDQPGERKRLGRAAFRRAARYSPARQRQRMMQLYRGMIMGPDTIRTATG